jgi:hypothetical protein
MTNPWPITEAYKQTFTSNVKAKIQLKGGKLAPLVSRGSYSGESAQVVNFIGELEFDEREDRYGDTKWVETTHTQAWISPNDYDVATPIDRIDLLRTIYDPTNPYVDAVVTAYWRKIDRIIAASFFADAMRGKKGQTLVPFDTANRTIVHGGTGLTIDKLRALKVKMEDTELDFEEEQPTIALTTWEIDNLLGTTQVTSSDYNNVKALVNGEVDSFMGFKFRKISSKMIPRLASDNTVRRLPVWLKSGMNFGDWQNLQIRISERADKNYVKQIHGSFTAGATRVEDEKVWELQAKQAA